VPFLRLTRDRRGFENTFLMHADRPGDRPRLLYWYRTAPGILLGRPALDEDAIRAIEEQHPDIDFDWPAILALSEVMTPEDEVAPKPQQKQKRRDEGRRDRREPRRDDRSAQPAAPAEPDEADHAMGEEPPREEIAAEQSSALSAAMPAPGMPRAHGLVDQLAGREIAARLRARYDEISARVREADASIRATLIAQAEALDPDRWASPEEVLQGVSNADALFDQLRARLSPPRQ
jgi:hypothetical protein